MLSVRRVSIGLVVFGGLVWALGSFGTAQSHQSAGQNNGTAQTAVDGPSGSHALLAARYHLRSRTSRFFQRASSSYRGRSGQSRDYYRSYRRGGRRIGGAAVEETEQLAARYHLRARTARFFRRAAA